MADQFLLLRIDADDRPPNGLERLPLRGDVLKLGIVNLMGRR
jgi:hypothetical protein